MDPTAIVQGQGYRPNVGIAVFNADGLILVAERLDKPGAWQMPQGGIDADEDPWRAALRELKEEIGTDDVAYLGEIEQWLRYDFPPGLPNPYKHNHLGQEQKWFAVRFTGDDSEIDLASTEPVEFAQWKWVSLEEIVGLIVEFKRETYREVVKEFARFARNSRTP